MTDTDTASRPQITDPDVDEACVAATPKFGEGLPVAGMRAALESTLRPGGLVARAIADELERIAVVRSIVQDGDGASYLRRTAAEWREGRR